jgi:hypothetical protein
MIDDKRSSVEIRQELEDAKSRLKSLEGERERIEKRLAEVKPEIERLGGGFWGRGRGTINKLGDDLSLAMLREQDAEKPRVVFSKAPNWGSEYVVSRVTPKRIFLRSPGSKREEQYYKDGTAVSSSGVIDIEATFPGGLK